MKKYLILLLWFILLPAFASTKKSINLDQYASIEKVSAIMRNHTVVHDLEKILGAYQDDFPFYNTDWLVFGEPHKTADGGLFVEAWLQDLYLYQAIAFVVFPDGKLYAGWVVPASEIIKYGTNVADSQGIYPDIQQWGERFKENGETFTSFTPRGKCGKETRYFNNAHVSIKIITSRASDGQCNKATYYGKRNKDGATLTLTGTAFREVCHAHPCKLSGFSFKNGTTTYSLDIDPPDFTITENGKILMSDTGTWIAPDNKHAAVSEK